VTIWFCVDGEALYVMTRDPSVDWVRNVQRHPEVEIELGPVRIAGRLETVNGPALEARIKAMAARKYWLAWLGSLVGVGPRRTFCIGGLVRQGE
jgi:hypothetical protein